MQPEVSIVMVGLDLWDMTKKAIEGLIFTMSQPWQLLFVNNGSSDQTREGFETIAPTWTWQYFAGYQAHNYGRTVALAHAWNRGWKMHLETSPRPEYVVFANNDIVFHQFGWWDKMKAALDDGLDLVGIQEMTWYKFRFVEGSLFAARSEVLEALQEKQGSLFDGRFKLSCEDVDLSHRFLKSGLSIGQVHGLQHDYLSHIGHATIDHKAQRGEDLYDKMHDARRELCKKWGYPEQIED